MALRVRALRRYRGAARVVQVAFAATALATLAPLAVSFTQEVPYLRHARLQAPRRRASEAPAVEAAEGALDELLELAAIEDPDTEEQLAVQVNASFGRLTPQDLTGLQARLAVAEDAQRPAIQRVAACVQQAMESRMAGATREIEALMTSSGDINENIRECLERQDSALPILTVLQMNIGRAQKSENKQQEKALTYLYTAIGRELEAKVPMMNRILSRCLSTKDSSARRELLKAFLTAPEAAEVSPQTLSQTIIGLVAEAEKTFASPENSAQRANSLDLIRSVAIDVGIVLGEETGEEAQASFTDGLQPLFEALSRGS
eukprot:TRINITY_DN38609_c0_g1_i1.p1 TRINITY_DN38609_c0_g1~~TRINITY_DN38609_c0_g1_i1.p1  ORF type:complete len:318 (-),score=75.23 TRINITY_DN38609_c0_g1_i1:63-1016(-)